MRITLDECKTVEFGDRKNIMDYISCKPFLDENLNGAVVPSFFEKTILKI